MPLRRADASTGTAEPIYTFHVTIAEWLAFAKADAVRRGLRDLVPILDALAASTAVLRAAEWNDDAAGETPRDGEDAP